MRTSLRVLRTKHEDQEVLYNSLTGQLLPLDATYQEFSSGFFLEGQDEEAIVNTLMKDREIFSITVVPTWECNLRCTHCSVSSLLQTMDSGEINTQKLINFISSYLERFKPKHMSLHFVGGEPFLRQDKCLEITHRIYELLEGTGIRCMASITTNGTIPITAAGFALVEALDKINFSIDGDHAQHNTQRKPLYSLDDPYQSVVSTVSKLIEAGYQHKIHVKTALRDQYYTRENFEGFLRAMGKIGVNLDHVLYGCLHPTDLKNHPDRLRVFMEIFGTKPMTAPCCKYRLNNVWLIDSTNHIYDLPYRWARTDFGELGTDLDEMLSKRRQIILEQAPCYTDETCRSCPVLGFCWGQCANSDSLVNHKPSQFCHQHKLIETVTEMQRAGTLVDFMQRQSSTAMIERYVK